MQPKFSIDARSRLVKKCMAFLRETIWAPHITAQGNASVVLKNFLVHPEKTFATISVRSGHGRPVRHRAATLATP